ncbi:Ubiquitin carboxyl-terminal hydrolase 27 [Acorus calamus]|uniref:Ubiquitin carboxyl-terminal hydrolase n=1 Tax=Acorus calamus TaxID=4465 RepID=A0AAV9DHC4_ACOCL|nr:Ubiquitin carboxyl-terminal hydrolase 27 [Acorus calamus]
MNCSPSQLHVLVAGALGAGIGLAGLAFAGRGGGGGRFGVSWVPGGGDDHRVSLSVAGLQNLGNNCFINVILQALASCCCFRPFLLNKLAAQDAEAEEKTEPMPLTDALISLLRELCVLRDQRTVLSPRRLILAMSLYVTSFDLSKQQDAAEAFQHLLHSLEEEFSEFYSPSHSSVADIFALPRRILCANGKGHNELEVWHRNFLVPFNGTLRSILTCRNCSSQISVDVEFFNCLPLSPSLDGSASIVGGCTLEDCLKQFTAVEHVENYQCSSCWHAFTIKYLSLSKEENKEKIMTLKHCVDHDSCHCKDFLRQEGITWSASTSSAFKQLSVGHCPEILCIQLQRVSMSVHGEMIKFQGHISFPLVLDFFPFTAAAMGMRIDMHQTPLISHPNHFVVRLGMPMLSHMYGLVDETSSLGACSGDVFTTSTNRTLGDAYMREASEPCVRETILGTRNCSSSEYKACQCENMGDNCSNLIPSKNYMYRLSSVVEHYGRSGSGHYMVYRRVRSDSDDNVPVGKSEAIYPHWVYVSDSEVSSVSEETVLAAEASLLFYEKVEVSS